MWLFQSIKKPSLSLPRFKLYQQIIICFVLVVLLPLSGVSFIIYSINQKALKKELARFTQYTAESLYRDFRTEMNWQQKQSRMMSLSFARTYENNRDFNRTAAHMFDIAPDFEALGYYDAQGSLLNAAYRNFERLSPELRLPQKLATSSPDIQYEVLYFSTGNPQESPYFLRTVTPLSVQDKSVFLVQQKHFSYLQNLVRSNQSLYDAFYIIDANGVIIAGPRDREKQISREDFEHFRKIKPGVTHEFSTTAQTVPETSEQAGANKPDVAEDDDEPPLQKVIVKMPDINWGIIIESPYHVRQTYIKRARNQTLLLILACLATVVLLALVYVFGISRNFRQLIKGIKAMAEGNYSRRIRLLSNFFTPYEIVYLAGEFNRMARKTAEAWQKSQALTEELLGRNEDEAFLTAVTKGLHGTLTVAHICRIGTENVGRHLNLRAVAIRLEERTSLPVDEPLRIWSASGEDPSALRQYLTETLSCDAFENWRGGLLLNQPIPYQDQPLGMLTLYRRHDGESTFSETEQHLIASVANQIGVALHQAEQWETIQQVNKQLAKLDELKSNLIDTVSHELRTPLTSIKGYTSRLLRYDATLDSETRIKSLKVVKQQADRLSRLVEDLLVIPDLESANLRVFPDQVELPALIERSVHSIQAKEYREIRVNLPEDDGLSVLADPDRLEQILVNLLDNAVKYSHADTPIHLSVSPDGVGGMLPRGPVKIRVSNACDPIPAEELATLFDKFKRLDDSLIRTTRGSGLGLFITKGLVEAMGGSIRLAYYDGQFHVSFSVPRFADSHADVDVPATP